VAWRELRDTPLIRVGTKTAIRSIIDDAVGGAHLTPNWQYEVQHVETAVHLVEAGLGFAVVLSVDVALHRGRSVVAVPLRAPKVEVTYGLVTRRGMPLSSAAAAVRELLAEEMNGQRS
jgi:DNA-binding transcriptional LysR family regulator